MAQTQAKGLMAHKTFALSMKFFLFFQTRCSLGFSQMLPKVTVVKLSTSTSNSALAAWIGESVGPKNACGTRLGLKLQRCRIAHLV